MQRHKNGKRRRKEEEEIGRSHEHDPAPIKDRGIGPIQLDSGRTEGENEERQGGECAGAQAQRHDGTNDTGTIARGEREEICTDSGTTSEGDSAEEHAGEGGEAGEPQGEAGETTHLDWASESPAEAMRDTDAKDSDSV